MDGVDDGWTDYTVGCCMKGWIDGCLLTYTDDKESGVKKRSNNYNELKVVGYVYLFPCEFSSPVNSRQPSSQMMSLEFHRLDIFVYV